MTETVAAVVAVVAALLVVMADAAVEEVVTAWLELVAAWVEVVGAWMVVVVSSPPQAVATSAKASRAGMSTIRRTLSLRLMRPSPPPRAGQPKKEPDAV